MRPDSIEVGVGDRECIVCSLNTLVIIIISVLFRFKLEGFYFEPKSHNDTL